MDEPKRWRLEIDGEDYTDDCDHIDVSTPSLVYDVPHDRRWQMRVLGPRGFCITITSPSGRLLALVDDGEQVHPLRVVYEEAALPVPVQFHTEWVERTGVRKMFGCLAVEKDSGPMWIDVHAGERREEGGQ